MQLSLPTRLFLFAVLFWAHPGIASRAKPADIESIVKEFPSRQLDLQTLILIGSRGQNFKSVQSEFALATAPQLEADAIYSPTLSLSAAQTVDETEKALPFEASTIHTESYEVKLSKLFMTGTAAEVGFAHLNYRPDYTSPGALTIPNYQTSTATFKISQPLWSNSFGYATRNSHKAASTSAKAQAAKAEALANEWFLEIADQLYKAWAAQQVAKANSEILQNRKKLLRIMRVNRRRGTAVSKDLLQLDAAVTINEIELQSAEDRLQAIWDTLVIVAALPADWANADSLKMPIALDNPFEEALSVCQSSAGKSEVTSSRARYLHLSRQAAEYQMKAAKNLINPELNLFGEYGSNEMGNRFSETGRQAYDFNHPSWTVGIELKVPFSFHAEKAKALRAYVSKVQAEAAAISALDDQKIVWQNSCRSLKLSQNRIQELEKALSNLKKRAQLEEADFRLGRASSFTFIQAGLDAINAELTLINEKVDGRLLAWNVIATAKNLKDKIKEFSSGVRSRISE